MNSPPRLTLADFKAALASAKDEREARLARLDGLAAARRVEVYSYGAKGKELALMLRAGAALRGDPDGVLGEYVAAIVVQMNNPISGGLERMNFEFESVCPQ